MFKSSWFNRLLLFWLVVLLLVNVIFILEGGTARQWQFWVINILFWIMCTILGWRTGRWIRRL